MKKPIIAFCLIVLAAVAAIYIFTAEKASAPGPVLPETNTFSPKDATYIIDGQKVTLKNGVSEVEAAPGSASKIITRYFGNEVKHDFNKDGREDVVFLLTQQTGGSGTFYYVVAALNTPQGYVGSQALLLGDRIAPQTTEMVGAGDVVVVNYADRGPQDSFAVAPSVGKSIWLLLDTKTMQFGEVDQNFEGEASPAVMTLDMKVWNWVSATDVNGIKTAPKDSKRFALTLKKNDTFSSSTDCNGVGGEYTVSGNKISFTRMMSTLMYCEGSQEGEYSKMLGDASGYAFTSKGEFVLTLKSGGSMVFK